jgi:imidazolonepropionase-like amidohydrolase
MGTDSRPSRRQLLGGAAAAATLAWAPRARAATVETTVSNARILLGDGTEVHGGIHVVDGFVRAVGPEVTGGEDLGGSVVYPGMYANGCPFGLYEVDLEPGTHDETESSAAVAPQVRVVDGYNPCSAIIPIARIQGLLGALVVPGGGLVSGQAAWVRTFGDTVADATILAPAGVCFNLGHGGTGATGGPASRMGVASAIRDLLDANPPKPEPVEAAKKHPKKTPTPPTRAQRILQALLLRETKAIFAAERADDIRTALAIAAEYDLDAVVLGAAEGHLVAKELAAAKVPVLLGPVTVQPSSFDTLHARYDNAALLHAAGVRFGFRVGDPHQVRDLSTEAGIAVANGLPWDAAIAALCGNGPSFWGLDVGTIRVGAEASFVQTDGDPLQPRTRVLATWCRGERLPLVSRQTVLYDRYKVLK